MRQEMQESGELAREPIDGGCVGGVYVFVHEKISADAPARGWDGVELVARDFTHSLHATRINHLTTKTYREYRQTTVQTYYTTSQYRSSLSFQEHRFLTLSLTMTETSQTAAVAHQPGTQMDSISLDDIVWILPEEQLHLSIVAPSVAEHSQDHSIPRYGSVLLWFPSTTI